MPSVPPSENSQKIGYLIREKIPNERGQWITIQTIYKKPRTGPEPE